MGSVPYDRGSLADRLKAGIDQRGPEECWPWKRGCSNNGYGTITLRKKCLMTHRVMWELVNGPIPEGMFILHACDNPRCCNPAHLRAGTPLENQRDMIQKGRLGKRDHAELHRLIVAAVGQGQTQAAVARQFGVTRQGVYCIMRRRRHPLS